MARLIALGLSVALAALTLPAADAIDHLRSNRALTAGSPLSIGPAPLGPTAGAPRPACLKPELAGKTWSVHSATDKATSKEARVVFSVAEKKLELLIHLIGITMGIHDRKDSNSPSWNSDMPVIIFRDRTACDFRISQAADPEDEGNVKQMEAMNHLLRLHDYLNYSITPRLGVGKTADDYDSCTASSVKGLLDSTGLKHSVDVLVNFIETKLVDEAEVSLFRHLDEYWAATLLSEHALRCPANWKAGFEDPYERGVGRSTFALDAWRAALPMAKCWKWHNLMYKEMAGKIKALAQTTAAELEALGEWAMYYCLRPADTKDACSTADQATKDHVAKLGEIKPEHTKFFADTAASIPAPSRPAELVELQNKQSILELPNMKGMTDTDAFILPRYYGPTSPSGPVIQTVIDNNMLAPSGDVTKGLQINYVKYNALVHQAIDQWIAKDKADQAEHSKKLTAGKSDPTPAGKAYWDSGNPTIPRRKLALEQCRAAVDADFWSKDPAVRAATRGEKATKAMAELATRQAAYDKNVAAAKPPGYIDCGWKPASGMDAKKRTNDFLDFLEGLAITTPFKKAPLSSCEPTQEQLRAECDALGEHKPKDASKGNGKPARLF